MQKSYLPRVLGYLLWILLNIVYLCMFICNIKIRYIYVRDTAQ